MATPQPATPDRRLTAWRQREALETLREIARDQGDLWLLGAVLTIVYPTMQIADMVGTSRETVTRVVKDLKESGWLRQEGKRYHIPQAGA